jgi:hypothetical protein
MKKALLFAFAAWTIISCNSNSKNQVVVYDTINRDTALFKLDSIAPDKNFSGILPCKDCDGINIYLTLHLDSTFIYTESKINDTIQNAMSEKTGSYSIDSNEVAEVIKMKFTDGSKMYFQICGDTAIQLLNSKMKELTTDENTFLKKN